MKELNYIDKTIERNENPALRIGGIGGSALSTVYLMDCIEGMKQFPDKFFDLAVVDPPYGLNGKSNTPHKQGQSMKNSLSRFKKTEWDSKIPPLQYFIELFRVSKNQIIWGGNYFIEHLPSTRGFITWDKQVYIPTMSRIEMAWTSFDKLPKLYQLNNNDPTRIHPTQKPVGLYDFCFYYAKIQSGHRVLDTHLGSGSSRIAANKAGLDFVGFEIDREYFDNGNKRFKNFVSQLRLF